MSDVFSRALSIARPCGQCKGKDAVTSLGEQHNVRGVLLDTQGPEIRTGNLEGNAKISLVQGSTIELTTDPVGFSRRDAFEHQRTVR